MFAKKIMGRQFLAWGIIGMACWPYSSLAIDPAKFEEYSVADRQLALGCRAYNKRVGNDELMPCDDDVARAENAKAAAALRDEIEAARRAEKAAEEKLVARQKAEAARRARLPGVAIGMTAKQVQEQTNWGRPLKVNRTTTAAGVSEQWVYGEGNYLYFRDGRLTAVQN